MSLSDKTLYCADYEITDISEKIHPAVRISILETKDVKLVVKELKEYLKYTQDFQHKDIIKKVDEIFGDLAK